MSDIELFKRSFNFDKTIRNKRCALLRNNTPYFKKLPVVVIHKIFKMLAFIAPGYYYYITDLHLYPRDSNQYIGKCCERRDNLVKISYNGWNDSFDEWVPIKNITYLDKTQFPQYRPGGCLDILDFPSSQWFKGLIWNVEIINNQQILTVIYKQYVQKKIIIVKNIPICYKYIAPANRHTFGIWTSPINKYYFKFNKYHPSPIPNKYIKTITNRLGYTLDVCDII